MMLDKLDKFNPLHINWINTAWNYGKRVLICSWKDHDYYKPYCFRCWKYFDPTKYTWSE